MHHLIIFGYIIYIAFWHSCDSKHSYIYVLADDVCLMQVKKEAVYGFMFTMGYLIYDYIIQVYYCAESNPLLSQIQFHHYIVFTGMICGLVVGYGFVAVGFLGLSIELSSIFLNYRSLFKREEMSKPIPTAIQLIFVVLYIFLRMVMLPYYYFLFVKILYYSWDLINIFQVFAGLLLIVISILMYGLHLIWFKQIMVGLAKAMGLIKRKERTP